MTVKSFQRWTNGHILSAITLVALVLTVSSSYAAETLTVSFQTTSAGGQYAPKNILAVWVETQSGTFVKTIGDWSGQRRADLNNWRAKAGTSDTDAIMGATRSNHTATLNVTWDMLPRGGTTAVADGVYVVQFETADTNKHRTSVSFTKNGTASIVGPVTQAGFNNITLTYTGRTGATPVISSANTASGSTGTPFSYSIMASNSPTSYSASGLPAGLSVNTTSGLISGTPTTAGTSTVTLGATNASGTGSQALTLTVTARPVITSATTASGTVGASFSYSIIATNTPTSYSATGLPTGLTLNTSSGIISGTPTIAATSSVTIGAINSGGTGTATLTLTINAPVAGAPVISSSSTANGALTNSFTYTITASNTPTSFSASGLPAGLSVNTSSGAIAGTPTVAGTFTVTIGATNGSGTGTSSLHLTILAAPVISSSASASGTRNTAFTYAITASNTPTSYSASGLPSGLSVNTSTGIISGTPTATGTSSITLGATNAAGTGNLTLTLTISGAPAVTSLLTDSATTGASYSYQITGTNNPTSYSATGLVAGLSINTATGVISGTPTVAGMASITIGATNAAGSGTATLSLTISSATTSSAVPTSQPAKCGYGTGYSAFVLMAMVLLMGVRGRRG
jgi:hypothetical protein